MQNDSLGYPLGEGASGEYTYKGVSRASKANFCVHHNIRRLSAWHHRSTTAHHSLPQQVLPFFSTVAMRLPAILASAALLNVPAFATPVDAQNALDRRVYPYDAC